MIKAYIGDGVTIELHPDRHEVILTTDDGQIETNRILLARDTLGNMQHYLKRFDLEGDRRSPGEP